MNYTWRMSQEPELQSRTGNFLSFYYYYFQWGGEWVLSEHSTQQLGASRKVREYLSLLTFIKKANRSQQLGELMEWKVN